VAARTIKAMTEYKASRTLVKSPPELWSEVSEASSLRRHLDQFGEIRITKLEPENAVAWEGDSARGTVRLEPSGWGTRVILTAEPGHDEAERVPGGQVEAEMRELRAVLELRSPNRARRSFRERRLVQAFLRWWGVEQRARAVVEAPARTPRQPQAPEVADPLGSAAAPALALNSALDSLGRAHHRPYSRA
jgi:hypothetical protein